MKTIILVLYILNILCLAFNIYRQEYFIAVINGLAILATANAALICD